MKEKDPKLSLIIVIVLTAAANILTYLLGIFQDYVTMRRTGLMGLIDQFICIFGCGLLIILLEKLTSVVVRRSFPDRSYRGALIFAALLYGIVPWFGEIGHELFRDAWIFKSPEIYTYWDGLICAFSASAGAAVCVIYNLIKAGKENSYNCEEAGAGKS